jgi:16S rRNA (cytidine1402-2'-O)-methyltransferase
MSGTLYLVATPIGNLSDMSERAKATLADADFIAAEDTRVTLRLLNHCGIKKQLVSYHEHNAASMGPQILERLLAGESCALVTDAGTPAISDPGEAMTRLCAENGVDVVSIPGCCALISALAVSALPTGRFAFEGFLPAARGERSRRLASLSGETRTMIFYEAPHRLRTTLSDLMAAFGADRPASLSREITKMHEQTLRTTLGGAEEYYRAAEPRGEYVIVVAGADDSERATATMDEGAEMVEKLREGGMKLRDAARSVSADTGLNKNALYEAALARRKG